MVGTELLFLTPLAVLQEEAEVVSVVMVQMHQAAAAALIQGDPDNQLQTAGKTI
jgi:hypothetical protein